MAESNERKLSEERNFGNEVVAAPIEQASAASSRASDEAVSDHKEVTIRRQHTAVSQVEERSDLDQDCEQVIFDLSMRTRRIITAEPKVNNSEETRRPLPITVGRLDSRLSPIVPTRGLQLLYDVTRLRIQQSFDIDHLTSELRSENRYLVRKDDENGGEETVLGCCESSSSWQRLLCGASRSFDLTLLDPTRQEAATFHRRLANSLPHLGIYLQRLDAYEAGGEYLGSVEQEWSPAGLPRFSVRDANGAVLYRIRGDRCCVCTSVSSRTDFVFHILNSDGSEMVSNITHQWDRELVDYNLSVALPPTSSTRSKVLVLAAAFLFEYTYFLPAKQSGYMKSCCK